MVIVGQTASGKSELAMYSAERFDGEIIAADSRTVYKGMDIATAKPSLSDQQQIKHHLLDVVSPEKIYTASDYKRAALAVIDDIDSRGKLPIMVGGSGLYIDAVINDYSFGKVDAAEKVRLSKLSLEELQKEAKLKGINEYDVSFKNRRHLERAVERGWAGQPNRQKLRSNTLIIGIKIDKDELSNRISKRAEQMFKDGIVEETALLLKKLGNNNGILNGIGYKTIIKYINGELSKPQAIQELISGDKKLAKRQQTWFKRNNSIHWITQQSEAVELVTTLLNNSL